MLPASLAKISGKTFDPNIVFQHVFKKTTERLPLLPSKCFGDQCTRALAPLLVFLPLLFSCCFCCVRGTNAVRQSAKLSGQYYEPDEKKSILATPDVRPRKWQRVSSIQSLGFRYPQLRSPFYSCGKHWSWVDIDEKKYAVVFGPIAGSSFSHPLIWYLHTICILNSKPRLENKVTRSGSPPRGKTCSVHIWCSPSERDLRSYILYMMYYFTSSSG